MTRLTRRRFIAISAAMAATAAAGFSTLQAKPLEWRGFAFGAEVSIKLDHGGEDAQAALDLVIAEMRKLEKLFSIYDPASALSSLNRDGVLAMDADFALLVQLADKAHKDTAGLFDPTVQGLFAAKLNGKATSDVLTGWEHVRYTNERIVLPKRGGMALTFNGIAQGYASDRVRDILGKHGFDKTLVNIGEFAAGDRNAKIGIADAKGEIFDMAEIRNQAIATSSPGGFRFADGSGHILRSDGKPFVPVWDTVSVIAKSATLADAYSTALVLAEDAGLAGILRQKGLLEHAVLRKQDGNFLRV